MGEPFRQGMRLPSLEVQVYTRERLIDFPAEYPGGVTFRMVGMDVVITGPATGSALGVLVYDWAADDLAIAGTYAACFVGIDATGRAATFPTGSNLEIVVTPAL